MNGMEISKAAEKVIAKLKDADARAAELAKKFAASALTAKVNEWINYVLIEGRAQKLASMETWPFYQWIHSGNRRGVFFKRGNEIYFNGVPIYYVDSDSLDKIAQTAETAEEGVAIADVREETENRLSEKVVVTSQIRQPGIYEINDGTDRYLYLVFTDVRTLDGKALRPAFAIDLERRRPTFVIGDGAVKVISADRQEMHDILTNELPSAETINDIWGHAVFLIDPDSFSVYVAYNPVKTRIRIDEHVEKKVYVKLNYSDDTSYEVVLTDGSAPSIDYEQRRVYIPRRYVLCSASGLNVIRATGFDGDRYYVKPDSETKVASVVDTKLMTVDAIDYSDRTEAIMSAMVKLSLSYEDAVELVNRLERGQLSMIEPKVELDPEIAIKLSKEMFISPQELESEAEKIERFAPSVAEMLRAVFMNSPHNLAGYNQIIEVLSDAEDALCQLYLLMQLDVVNGDPAAVKSAIKSITGLKRKLVPVISGTEPVKPIEPNYEIFQTEEN